MAGAWFIHRPVRCLYGPSLLTVTYLARQRILTDDGGLKVNKDGSRHVFAGSRLAEERVERVVSSSDCLVARHLTIGLDAMLQTVQLPAGVAHLHSGLADMDADAFTLQPSHIHLIIPRILASQFRTIKTQTGK